MLRPVRQSRTSLLESSQHLWRRLPGEVLLLQLFDQGRSVHLQQLGGLILVPVGALEGLPLGAAAVTAMSMKKLVPRACSTYQVIVGLGFVKTMVKRNYFLLPCLVGACAWAYTQLNAMGDGDFNRAWFEMLYRSSHLMTPQRHLSAFQVSPGMRAV